MTKTKADPITPLTPAEEKLIKQLNEELKNGTITEELVLQKLKTILTAAVKVELATIPLYLYTYYSINRQPQSNYSKMDPPAGWDGPGTPHFPNPDSYPKGSGLDPKRIEELQVFANRAGATIMSVAVEEMLHLSLSSNLLFALGGTPEIYNYAPCTYPTNLAAFLHDKKFWPYHDEPKSKYYKYKEPMPLDLGPISYAHLWQFIQIEWPENPQDHPQSGGPLPKKKAGKSKKSDPWPWDERWDTIGQVYSYVRCLILSDAITDEHFMVRENGTEYQLQPGYYSANNVDTIYAKGNFDKSATPNQRNSAAKKAVYEDQPDSHAGASELMTVYDKRTALAAIATICDQGEGFNPHHVGATDDQSGHELSHYWKFVTLQNDIDVPKSWKKRPYPLKGPINKLKSSLKVTEEELSYFVFPFLKNPTTEKYAESDKVVGKISDAFNALFQYMLIMTEATLWAKGPAQKKLFYTGMHNSMIWIMDKYAQAMRKIEVEIGRKKYAVAPTFEFVELGKVDNGYLGALTNLKAYAQAALDAITDYGKQDTGPVKNYSDVAYYLKLIVDPALNSATNPPLPDVHDFYNS